MAAETPMPLGPSPARRDVLAHCIRLLVAATIAYNVIEAVVALTAGSLASSTALIGFGLDSVIEVSSAAAVAWQFSAREHAVREARERRALRIVVAAVSLAVMPFLSAAQRRTGRELGSASTVADSQQTLLCTYLSAVLLLGLLLNATLGWSWADPAAALVIAVIAVIAVKEGREAWRGEGCCEPRGGRGPGGPGFGRPGLRRRWPS